METNTKRNLILGISITTIIVLITSVVIYKRTKENNAWELAKTKNNIVSYSNYIKSFPDGRYRTSADSLIEYIYWENALKINTLASYDSFISKFPKGNNFVKADSIREELLWNRALSSPKTDSAYIDYIKKYPLGKHKHDANKFIVFYKLDIGRINDKDVPNNWGNGDPTYSVENEKGNEYVFRWGPDSSVKIYNEDRTSYTMPNYLGYAKVNNQIQIFRRVSFNGNVEIYQNDDYKITIIINPKLTELGYEFAIDHGEFIVTKKNCGATKKLKVARFSGAG